MPAARVLLADNDRDVANVVRLVLERDGFAVDYAADGERCLAAIADEAEAGQPYDLVVLDLRMPGIGGFGVVERLAQLDAAPAVLVLSGFVDGPDRDRLEASSVVRGILTKPFDFTDLSAAAQAAVDGESA